ncbi:hypothetical protein KSD_88100 [Ktedonobacter sp. SOSP1-85]|nr:hypothetical protein KSD_88100 [Ktedonobacter sp. SOSP1-85]
MLRRRLATTAFKGIDVPSPLTGATGSNYSPLCPGEAFTTTTHEGASDGTLMLARSDRQLSVIAMPLTFLVLRLVPYIIYYTERTRQFALCQV